MKTSSTVLIIIALWLIVIPVSEINAEPVSISGQQDIGMLMDIAENTFDLKNQDAVLLFEGQKQFWLPDGRLKTLVHEIVWIGTEQGIDHYADLRIPYDDDHTTFQTVALRTWRENRWWVSGETAMIETLPFAVNRADAYTHMREMMLLHDGVELPCIMETAYIIEDKEPFRSGAEGIWHFRHDDPVVWSWFILGVPSGKEANVYASGDVPNPDKETDQELELDLYTYKMGPFEEMGRPHIADPAEYCPYVAWSTWSDWKSFGANMKARFDSALVLDDALVDSVDKLTENAPVEVVKAKNITCFINKYTRYVNYSWRFWQNNPRNADEVFSTAYGHRLDRAVLAGAMFKQVGFKATPVFRSLSFGDIYDGIATLGRFDGISLWISGEGVEAFYDPESGVLTNGLSEIFGRTVWLPGIEDIPAVRWSGKGESSKLELRIKLGLDKENEKWTGRGFFSASGGLCPYEKMEGLKSEAVDYLGSVVSGVIEGAEVTGYNPTVFDRFQVITGYEFEAPLEEEDVFGRVWLVAGDPDGGLIAKLPHDVHLNEEHRQSPVHLPGIYEQTVIICMDGDDLEIVRLPEERIIENNAGTFSISIKNDDQGIKIIRKIKLNDTFYPAENWKELRELLLAERSERSKTILIKL